MNPILASGAASLAGVLINKVSGHSSSPSGNLMLEPKEFERALNRAGGSRDRQAVQQQAADLHQKLLQRPEVEAAIYSQPPGAVTGLELRADGSLSLRTSAGPVAVQMGSATRELAQAVYSASAVQAAAGVATANSAPQAPLLLPLQMVQGAALR